MDSEIDKAFTYIALWLLASWVVCWIFDIKMPWD